MQDRELIRPNIQAPTTVSWTEFQCLFHWEQGQHLTLLGPTGYGKSTTTRLLLPCRDYVVFFATKRKDKLYDELKREGFEEQKAFKPELSNRILLKPPIDPDDETKQRAEFSQTITEVYWQGGWTIVWDEAVYVADYLKLEKKMSFMWQQARSHFISIVAGTQRPAFIPLYAYDQPTHFFFWKMKLDKDVQRVARLGGLDIGGMMQTIRSLPKYTFLYYNKDTDVSYVCKPEV